jgi:hypothetical protein
MPHVRMGAHTLVLAGHPPKRYGSTPESERKTNYPNRENPYQSLACSNRKRRADCRNLSIYPYKTQSLNPSFRSFAFVAYRRGCDSASWCWRMLWFCVFFVCCLCGRIDLERSKGHRRSMRGDQRLGFVLQEQGEFRR